MKHSKTTKYEKHKIAKEILIERKTYKEVAAKYGITTDNVSRIIWKHNTAHARVIPVSMGEKRQPYWENEMDYWTGRPLLDNPFKYLRPHHMMEEIEKIEAEKLKIPIVELEL
jgi:hypothetical protein